MIKVLTKLPRDLYLALSGGVDSVAILDFLSKNHNITVAHMDHKEGNSEETADFVKDLCKKYNVNFLYKSIKDPKPARSSREEFWRSERYKFFHSLDSVVVTAHNLNDCVETWLWSSMHGTPKLIPYTNKNVVRPFLTTTKNTLISWATSHNLKWVEDESNKDLSLTRNYIRHKLMPHALVVNPGLEKTIARKLSTFEYFG